ncbi:MAG: hypothetical protein HFE86_05430 [Clostridiales bacterium]|nr:hypothetical protein [Clostridiales bacterium]
MGNHLDKQDQSLLRELEKSFQSADKKIQPPVSLAPCMIVRRLEKEGGKDKPGTGWLRSGRGRKIMAAALSAVLALGGAASVWLNGRRLSDLPQEPSSRYAELFQPDLTTGKRNSYYDIYLALERIRRRQEQTGGETEAALPTGDTGLQSRLLAQRTAGLQLDQTTGESEDMLTTSETASDPSYDPPAAGTSDILMENTTQIQPPYDGDSYRPTTSVPIAASVPSATLSGPTDTRSGSLSILDPALEPADDGQADDRPAASSRPASQKKPDPTTTVGPYAICDKATADRADWKTGSLAAFQPQVPAVNEVDAVQADGSRLYILSRGVEDRRLLSIVETAGGRMKLLSSTYVDFTGDREIQMHLAGDLLIVLGDQDESLGGMAADGIVKAEFYDISDRSKPVLTRIWKQQGFMSGSRLADGTLYISTTPYYPHIPGLNEELAKNYLPRFWDSGSRKINPLHPGQVQIVEDTETASYCFVAALNPTGGGRVCAALGGGDVLYSNTDNLYIAAVRQTEDAVFSEILRFTMGYDMRYTGRGRLPGAVSDSMCMDAREGRLRVVSQIPDSKGSGLYILDEGLAIAGELEGIAPGQTVQSVRFDGDTAYLAVDGDEGAVLTIDLENPVQPVIAGSASIPGFTGMLYPVAYGRLLAVEEAEEGLRLRLFDISEPTRPSQLTCYTAAAEGTRLSSEAAYDHHAMTYLSQQQLFLMPVTAASGFSGILAVGLTGDGLRPKGLITTARRTSETLYEVEKGDWARRTVAVDEVGFAVADGAVMAFDLDGLQKGLTLRLYDSGVKIVSFSGVDGTPVLSADD